jgi:hypothetical protein
MGNDEGAGDMAGGDNNVVLTWTLGGVLLQYLIGMALYVYRKNTEYCRAQMFGMSIASHIVAIMLLTIQWGSTWIPDYPCPMALVMLLLIHTLTVFYNIRSLLLFLKLDLADRYLKSIQEVKQSIAVPEPSFSRSQEVTSSYVGTQSLFSFDMMAKSNNEGFLQGYRNLASPKTVFTYCGILIVPPSIFCVVTGVALGDDTVDDCIGEYGFIAYTELTFVILMLYDFLFQVYVLWRLRRMNDAFGVKSEISTVAVTSFLGLVFSILAIYFSDDWFMWLSVILVLMMVLISLMGIWRPVLGSWLDDCSKKTSYRTSVANETQKEFLIMIQDKQALKLFEEHLVREFCFENWAFLKDVRKLLEAINRNQPYSVIMRKLQSIFDQFVASDAITPVNLSGIDRLNFTNAYNALMENSGVIGESNYQRVVSELRLTLKQCETAILYLLVSDSYRRFKATAAFESLQSVVERDLIIRDALRMDTVHDPPSRSNSTQVSQTVKWNGGKWSKDGNLRKMSEPFLVPDDAHHAEMSLSSSNRSPVLVSSKHDDEKMVVNAKRGSISKQSPLIPHPSGGNDSVIDPIFILNNDSSIPSPSFYSQRTFQNHESAPEEKKKEKEEEKEPEFYQVVSSIQHPLEDSMSRKNEAQPASSPEKKRLDIRQTIASVSNKVIQRSERARTASSPLIQGKSDNDPEEEANLMSSIEEANDVFEEEVQVSEMKKGPIETKKRVDIRQTIASVSSKAISKAERSRTASSPLIQGNDDEVEDNDQFEEEPQAMIESRKTMGAEASSSSSPERSRNMSSPSFTHK